MTVEEKPAPALTHINDGHGMPRCQAPGVSIEDLVDAALQAGCDDCRTMVMVGPTTQRGCEVRPRVVYTPEPLPDAEDLLAAALHRRNATR